tara:strand:- start:1443 stop:2627 length:1185 start_codon:yes stop_codon:yes gene_type:complete
MKLLKKPIVIVGGGFAGINAALSLKNINFSLPILVIDSHSEFIFKPLLYEVFSDEIKPWEVSPNFENIFSDTGIGFLRNQVMSIDLNENILKLKDNIIIDFQYLIIATGSSYNDFSIKGVNEYCYFFNDNNDQKKLKSLLSKSFTDNLKKEIFIIGGGPSGVELACKIHDMYNQNFKINIVEREGEILRNNKEYNREEAEKAIKSRKINLLLNTAVNEITETDIKVTNKLKEFTTMEHYAVVWTAGVKPNIPEISPDIKKINDRVLVNRNLQLPGFENIFVIGDIAIVDDNFDLPITAQVAMQQGKLVAENLYLLINQSPLANFVFKDNGEMISLGVGEASISGLGLTLSGRMAFELRRLIYASKMPLFERGLKSTASWLLAKKSFFKQLITKK